MTAAAISQGELDCLERVVRAVHVTVAARALSVEPGEFAALARSYYERTLIRHGDQAKYIDILTDVSTSFYDACAVLQKQSASTPTRMSIITLGSDILELSKMDEN